MKREAQDEFTWESPRPLNMDFIDRLNNKIFELDSELESMLKDLESEGKSHINSEEEYRFVESMTGDVEKWISDLYDMLSE